MWVVLELTRDLLYRPKPESWVPRPEPNTGIFSLEQMHGAAPRGPRVLAYRHAGYIDVGDGSGVVTAPGVRAEPDCWCGRRAEVDVPLGVPAKVQSTETDMTVPSAWTTRYTAYGQWDVRYQKAFILLRRRRGTAVFYVYL